MKGIANDRRTKVTWAIISTVVFWGGCTEGDAENPKWGGTDGEPVSCTVDEDCDDGVFCNGIEKCTELGSCDYGSLPCGEGATCYENENRCVVCDLDGDGDLDPICGGSDCDDADPSRNSAAVEVCDVAGVDEDCDPATLGHDVDGDGHFDSTCCNFVGGTMICGDDCDDEDALRNPSETEVCDPEMLDEDCDLSTFGRDTDSDGYHDPACCNLDENSTAICGNDCDDADPGRNPGMQEVCDPEFVDEDCDLSTFGRDEDGDGFGDPNCCNWENIDNLICGDDCMDLNADVNPSQTGYFTVDRGDGSFDYDCSGYESYHYDKAYGCISGTSCCDVNRPGWSSYPVPDCGESKGWVDGCSGPDGTRIQECR